MSFWLGITLLSTAWIAILVFIWLLWRYMDKRYDNNKKRA